VSPIERDMIARFVMDQAQPITPVQERAMARMLRRAPEVVKDLIQDARVTFAKRAPRYVDIHLRATEKALASGTMNGLETALRGSQWAIERIAQDGARVIDPPNAAASSAPRIIIGVEVGAIKRGVTEIPLPPAKPENT
jgi:hypothetical protein